MEYVVIRSGGKQYRVRKGDIIDVEKIDVKEEGEVVFNEVLLLADKKLAIGQPLVKNAKAVGKVLEQFKGDKIRVARFRHRKRHHKVKGHRQRLTKVKIIKIET